MCAHKPIHVAALCCTYASHVSYDCSSSPSTIYVHAIIASNMYVCLIQLSNAAGSKVHMLASTVSSKFIQSMGNVEGFQFEVCSNSQALYTHPVTMFPLGPIQLDWVFVNIH